MSAPLIAGRYLVLNALGAPGAQGEVYRVHDTFENDIVALKLLTSLPAGGPWAEAQILRRLSDNHILPIRNADHASGRPFLVTELALHGTLADSLGASPCGIEVASVVDWIRQACHGVARAHDLRLLHNDLKPANLFLNAQGECLVGDFGFASVIPPGVDNAFPPGATAQTAAPEIAANWGTPTSSASIRSDVYSLGSTAYWLLAGHTAHDFAGATDIAAMMARVASKSFARLRDVAPHVPRSVADVVEVAMAVDPANRYGSTTALASALGARSTAKRLWQRTNEHPGHMGCWRGAPRSGGSTYLLCLQIGSRPSKCDVSTVHLGSGRRVPGGSRKGSIREWGHVVRSVMRAVD